MDLLPKEHKQFQEEAYWSKFFSDKQTNQGFEWYASYEELEYYLKHTIKEKESNILVVGCGNSLLSEKMNSKMKLEKIVSIDFEENVVKKMTNRGTPVEYKVMDMLTNTFEDGSFDFAIDKGTLDALCVDKSQDTASKVIKYFNEVCRVLNPKGGTYVCVSLLQDFVLDALLAYFSKGIGNQHYSDYIVDFKIQKIEKIIPKSDDGSFYLPFYVTIKMTKIAEDSKLHELRKTLSEKVTFQDSPVGKAEFIPLSGIQDRIRKEQITQMFIPKMKELNLGQKYEMYCYDKNINIEVPRYTLTVIDSNDSKVLKKRSCGAFITPQGKERDSMISTEVGKYNLSQQAGYSRLIIITLNHGHKFENIETVKSELSPKVIDLAPSNCSNYKEIPFLTIGTDIGERQEIYRSPDGSIFVEDLKDNESNIYRQIIFSTKPEQIQSEVLFVYRNSKKGEIPDHLKAQSPIAPKKKQRALVFNHELLCSEYQYSMLSGFCLAPQIVEKQQIRILVLGTGAGLLPMFLKNQLGDKIKEIVTVDINPEIIKIAKEFFGFVEDAKLKSVIADAYEFVNQGGSQQKFDVVIMDINYEESDLELSPPMKFLDSQFLQNLLDLTTKEGFVTFNLLCKEKEIKDKVYEMISKVQKAHKYLVEGEEDVNRVIHLLKGEVTPEDSRQAQMEKFIKEFGINKGLWLTEMRIKQKIDKIQDIK